MEDKTFIINEKKYNSFKFYNMNLKLTDLKYLDTERVIFSKPVARKLSNPNGKVNISFNRIFVAITGPKPRNVTEGLKGVYDVNELLDYDSQTETTEFSQKYDFSKLEETDYHILFDYHWFKNNIDSSLNAPSFVYNMNENLYHDEPTQKELIMEKFTVFNATELYKKKPTIINKIPFEHFHILLKKKWVKENLSEKYLDTMRDDCQPLVIPSEEVFTFGVARNEMDTNAISFAIPLILHDRENPTHDEVKWSSKYEELATICREHVKKSEFKKMKGMIDLTKGLTWKNNEVGHPDGPKLYPKVMYNQKKEQFITHFTDENEEQIEDVSSILKRRAKVKVSLRFESIYVGSVVALQVRVNDVSISTWIESFKTQPLIVRKPGPQTKINPLTIKAPSDDAGSDFESSGDEKEESDSKVKRVVTQVKM